MFSDLVQQLSSVETVVPLIAIGAAVVASSLLHPTIGPLAVLLVVGCWYCFNPEEQVPRHLWAIVAGLLVINLGRVVVRDTIRSSGKHSIGRLVKSLGFGAVFCLPVILVIYLLLYETPRLVSHVYWEGCGQLDSPLIGSSPIEISGAYDLHLPFSEEILKFVPGYIKETLPQSRAWPRSAAADDWYLFARPNAPSALDGVLRNEFRFYFRSLSPCGSGTYSGYSNQQNTSDTVSGLIGFAYYVLKKTGEERIKSIEASALTSANDVRDQLFGASASPRAGVLPALLPPALQPPRCRGWLRTPTQCMTRRILVSFNDAYQAKRQNLIDEFNSAQDTSAREATGAAKYIQGQLDAVLDQEAQLKQKAMQTVDAVFRVFEILSVYSKVWLILVGMRTFLTIAARCFYGSTDSKGFVLRGKDSKARTEEPKIKIRSIGGKGHAHVDFHGLDWQGYGSGVSFSGVGNVGIRRVGEVPLKKLRLLNRFITHYFDRSVGSLRISTEYSTDFAEVAILPGGRCMVALDNVVAFSNGMRFKTIPSYNLSSLLTGRLSYVAAEAPKTRGVGEAPKAEADDEGHQYMIVCARRTHAYVHNHGDCGEDGYPSIIAVDVNGHVLVKTNFGCTQVYLTRTLFAPGPDAPAVLAHAAIGQRSVMGNLTKTIGSILIPL